MDLTAQLDPRKFTSVDYHAIQALPAALQIEAVVDQAAEWIAQPDATSRRAGLNILGVLALDHPYAFPRLLSAVPCATSDQRVTVRRALARALGTHADARVRPGLLQLIQDEDVEVRVLVAAGLPLTCIDDDPGEREVASALLRMLHDEDGEVRDWSTFALGVQMDIDTAEVRDALVRMLRDEGGDTAGEAALGLARRRDPRVLQVLLEELQDDYIGNLYVEAAAHLADALLLPALRALKEHGWEGRDPRPDLLSEAIDACRSGIPPEE